MASPMTLVLLHADLDALGGDAGPGDPAWLDPSERERVGRKRDARQRQRQEAALVFVRLALGRHCGIGPAALPLRREAKGKPCIDPAGWRRLGRDDPPPHYSLSHCGGLALLAIADRPVGVDLEARIPSARPALAERVLAAAELRAWRELDAESRIEALTVAWVRKEAVLKATGLGLGFGLRRLALGWEAGPVDIDLGKAGCWRVADAEAPPGHRAALALAFDGPSRNAAFR